MYLEPVYSSNLSHIHLWMDGLFIKMKKLPPFTYENFIFAKYNETYFEIYKHKNIMTHLRTLYLDNCFSNQTQPYLLKVRPI